MNEQNLFTVCVKLHNNVHNLKNRILCIKIQISKSKQFIREEQTYTQFTQKSQWHIEHEKILTHLWENNTKHKDILTHPR